MGIREHPLYRIIQMIVHEYPNGCDEKPADRRILQGQTALSNMAM